MARSPFVHAGDAFQDPPTVLVAATADPAVIIESLREVTQRTGRAALSERRQRQAVESLLNAEQTLEEAERGSRERLRRIEETVSTFHESAAPLGLSAPTSALTTSARSTDCIGAERSRPPPRPPESPYGPVGCDDRRSVSVPATLCDSVHERRTASTTRTTGGSAFSGTAADEAPTRTLSRIREHFPRSESFIQNRLRRYCRC